LSWRTTGWRARDMKSWRVSLPYEGNATPLFTENETNAVRHCGQTNGNAYAKDAFHEYVVHSNKEAVNLANTGTKFAPHYVLEIDAGQSPDPEVLPRALGG